MFHTYKRDKTTVPPANANKVRWFIDSITGLLTFVDSSGVVTTAGNGVESIVKTSTNGLVDTYTITYQDNTFDTFTVTNGQDGTGMPSVVNPSSITPLSNTAIGTITTQYALADHVHNINTAPPVNLGASAQEGTSLAFARADHVHPLPTAAQVGAATQADINAAVNSIPKLIRSSFVVPFTDKFDIQFVEVTDADISPTNPPMGFTVKSEMDWDLSYTVSVDVINQGSFEVIVTAQDTNGDPLIDLPLPQVTIYYFKEV